MTTRLALIEAGLHRYCDAVWIVATPVGEAKRRLMQERDMSGIDAELRLRAQPPLRDKLKLASVVIDNSGSIEATRVQVARAFAAIDPQVAGDKTQLLSHLLKSAPSHPAALDAQEAQRGGSG